jgi:hypothetical protein
MLADIAGPTFGQLNDLGEILPKLRQAESKKDYQKIGRDLFYLMKRNTPFQNHFLVAPVTDMLFMDKLQEAMNPGWALRQEERARENGQSYLFNNPVENVQ